ncbi:MAG: hypothetical protein C5B50_13835, partial [Verrucomicrobia bacterium]
SKDAALKSAANRQAGKPALHRCAFRAARCLDVSKPGSGSSVKSDMAKQDFIPQPTWRDRILLAVTGVLLTVFIGLLGWRSGILRDLGGGLIPLGGEIDGIWPHPFYRVMHNLTHPLLLGLYAVGFAWLPFHVRFENLRGRGSLLLFPAIILAHACFCLAYLLSLFLPVGDMITTIRQ